MTAETPAERWLALLEAATLSPVRRQIHPAGIPPDPSGEVTRKAREAAGRLPALAPMLGMSMPPPPKPVPGERVARSHPMRPAPRPRSPRRPPATPAAEPAHSDDSPRQALSEEPAEATAATVEGTPPEATSPEATRAGVESADSEAAVIEPAVEAPTGLPGSQPAVEAPAGPSGATEEREPPSTAPTDETASPGEMSLGAPETEGTAVAPEAAVASIEDSPPAPPESQPAAASLEERPPGPPESQPAGGNEAGGASTPATPEAVPGGGASGTVSEVDDPGAP